MQELFFVVNQEPKAWADSRGVCHAVVTKDPWEHSLISIGGITIKGRKNWGAPMPVWRNEVVYYNTTKLPLVHLLNKMVIHHTNNTDTVIDNERKQQARGFAALGYHFFIDKNGEIFEGRPLEIMGSHAGSGDTSGPMKDPDWGAVGIALQGDFHHADDWFFSSKVPEKQLHMLEKLACALQNKYCINQLLMHREMARSGEPTVCPGDHLVPHIAALRKKLDLRGK